MFNITALKLSVKVVYDIFIAVCHTAKMVMLILSFWVMGKCMDQYGLQKILNIVWHHALDLNIRHKCRLQGIKLSSNLYCSIEHCTNYAVYTHSILHKGKKKRKKACSLADEDGNIFTDCQHRCGDK